MSKRKLAPPTIEASSNIPDESSSEDDTDMIDIQFEWFDPQPAHDFHGLRTLLRQLLDVDSTLFDLSALVEVVLAQPLLGSTVKVDGNETDPYAFLSVVGIGGDGQEGLKPCVGKLVEYLLDRCSVHPRLQPLREVLTAATTTATNGSRIGIILTEKLINIPSEVVPPMYKMLLEEISWAVEEEEPYSFSHYVILSKTYTEVESVLDDEEADGGMSSKGKKMKKKKRQRMGKDGSSVVAAQEESSIFYFHPEDEVLQRYATCWGGFEYVNQKGEGETDAKRTFQELGIRPQGHAILIEAGKFEAAVKAVEEYLAQN